MHPIFWFAIILCLALVYGWRMQAVIGRVSSSLLHWSIAVSLVVALAVGGVLATHYAVRLPHDAGVAIHAAVLFICSWLGLRYWFSWRGWDVPAAVVALSLVGLYFIQPQQYNNSMLSAISLGIAVGGYYVTKRWLRVFYCLMAVCDAYMVWWSNLADQLTQAQSGLFPASLVVGMLRLPFLEISTLDIALSAMAIVGVQRHRGFGRAALLGLYCATACLVQAELAQYLAPRGSIRFLGEVPFLVVLAPIVLFSLRSSPISQTTPACS